MNVTFNSIMASSSSSRPRLSVSFAELEALKQQKEQDAAKERLQERGKRKARLLQVIQEGLKEAKKKRTSTVVNIGLLGDTPHADARWLTEDLDEALASIANEIAVEEGLCVCLLDSEMRPAMGDSYSYFQFSRNAGEQQQQQHRNTSEYDGALRAKRLSDALLRAKKSVSPPKRIWIGFADSGDAHGGLDEDVFDDDWRFIGQLVATEQNMRCTYEGPNKKGSSYEYHYLVFEAIGVRHT